MDDTLIATAVVDGWAATFTATQVILTGPRGQVLVDFDFPAIGRPHFPEGSGQPVRVLPTSAIRVTGEILDLDGPIRTVLDGRLAPLATGGADATPITLGDMVLHDGGAGFELLAPIAERVLYDIALRADDGGWVRVAPHAVYHRKDWSTTGIESLATSLRWSGQVLDSGLLDPLQRARLLALSGAQRIFPDPVAARAGATEALPVLLDARDSAYLLSAYQTLAWERCNAGDLSTALEYADLSVEAGRASTPERLADALAARAVMASEAGMFEAAQRDSDEAWAIVRDSGSAAALVSVGCNLAHPMMEHGRPELAAELMQAAIREMRRLPSFPVPRFITLNAGWAALGCRRYPTALAAFAETLEGNGDSDADPRAAETYAGAACAAIGVGHPLGGPFLAAANTLLERIGLVLTPWELGQMAEAGAVAPSGDRRQLDPTSSLGAHLRQLLTIVTADVCTDRVGPELPAPRASAAARPATGTAHRTSLVET